jgi:hypothetical protein
VTSRSKEEGVHNYQSQVIKNTLGNPDNRKHLVILFIRYKRPATVTHGEINVNIYHIHCTHIIYERDYCY